MSQGQEKGLKMKLSRMFKATSLDISIGALTMTSALAQDNATKEIMEVKVTQNQINCVSNIVYSQIITPRSIRKLHMTVLTPNTNTYKPAIIFFPGGGFTTADHEKYFQMRYELAKAGYVVAAAEYRTVPNTFPAPLIDGKAAVRYLRAHADIFGIDVDKIGVLGDSAGGYMSQIVGTTNGETKYDVGDFKEFSSDVQAVCTIYGISNLLNIGEGFDKEIVDVHHSPAVTEALLVHGPAFNLNPGSSILSDEKKALEASSIGHIKKDLPPFLIMHGDQDKLVSPVQSEQLYEALKKNGTKVDYVVLKGANHGDAFWYQKPVFDKVVSWFKENLHASGKVIEDKKKVSNL